MPNVAGLEDVVANVGGLGRVGGRPSEVVDSFEACNAAASGPPDWDWALGPSLNERRMNQNAVLLPDGNVLVIGGRKTLQDLDAFTRFPELFSLESKEWILMPKEASVRGYHSTAALLPDGRVLITTGSNRYCFDGNVDGAECIRHADCGDHGLRKGESGP